VRQAPRGSERLSEIVTAQGRKGGEPPRVRDQKPDPLAPAAGPQPLVGIVAAAEIDLRDAFLQ